MDLLNPGPSHLHELLIQHVGLGTTTAGGLLREVPQPYSILWGGSSEWGTWCAPHPTRPRPSRSTRPSVSTPYLPGFHYQAGCSLVEELIPPVVCELLGRVMSHLPEGEG